MRYNVAFQSVQSFMLRFYVNNKKKKVGGEPFDVLVASVGVQLWETWSVGGDLDRTQSNSFTLQPSMRQQHVGVHIYLPPPPPPKKNPYLFFS